MLMNARSEHTIAVSMQFALIPLGLTTVLVSLDFTEMGGRAKISMNARRKNTIAVIVQFAVMPLVPTIARALVDTTVMVGHAKT